MLFIYLAVLENALSNFLIVEREKYQRLVYFLSHALEGAEAKYLPIEKMMFALVMVTRRLKPYFQAHPIKILTSQPLRKVIEGKNQSSRVDDCANQLFDYRMEFELLRAIKSTIPGRLHSRMYFKTRAK